MSGLAEFDRLLSRGVSELIEENLGSLMHLKAEKIFKLVSFLGEELSADHRGEDPDHAWVWASKKITAFAMKRGCKVEFDVTELEKGDLSAVVEATVQILGLLSVYKKKVWEKVLASLENGSREQLEDMIKEVAKEFVKESASMPLDIKRLLTRIEFEETKRIQAEEVVYSLTLAHQNLKTEVSSAKEQLTSKLKEIEEANKIKDLTMKQIDELSSTNSSKLFENQSQIVKNLNKEKEALGQKVNSAEAKAAECMNELEKVKVLLAVSESKRREAEALQEIVEKLKETNDELAVDKEVCESKLELVNAGEKAIFRYQERVKEQTQKNFDLKLQITDLESKINSMERKLESSSENIKFLKQTSATLTRADTPPPLLEAENQNLKNEIRKLYNEINKIALSKLEKEGQLNNFEFQNIKFKTLSLEKNVLLNKNRKLEIASKIGTFNNFDNILKEFNEQNMPQCFRVSAELNETLEKERKKDKKLDDETFDMLYTICSNYTNEMLKDLEPKPKERERDVLRQFTLNNLLKITHF